MRRYAPRTSFVFGLALDLALTFALAAFGSVSEARAEAPATGRGKLAAATPALLHAAEARALVQRLARPAPEEVKAALGAATTAGRAAAAVAPAIEVLLQKGAPAGVARAAIEALEAIGAVSSSGVLRPYLRHRSPDLRRAAARALAVTGGPEAIAGYEEALRGPDADLRGEAARGLGRLGAAVALPELFLALDHNVNDAAPAIGELCSGEACARLAERLGHAAPATLASGLDPVFFRVPALPDEALVAVVSALGASGTSEALRYLTDVRARLPASTSRRVQQALDDARPAPAREAP
jgi:HEAT repeats